LRALKNAEQLGKLEKEIKHYGNMNIFTKEDTKNKKQSKA